MERAKLDKEESVSDRQLGYSEAAMIAREYYNNADADAFYTTIWGGEDIHLGLYASASESIFDASRRSVVQMAELAAPLTASTRVLDIGSGYGGPARYLASRFGCQVTALNLSEKENERARVLNREQGLEDAIHVIDGSFEDIPLPATSVDRVWSQDALLHSDNRDRVVSEVARVLRPGGKWVFTDPMQSDTCPDGVLQPILDRLHLSSLASPQFYRDACQRYGLAEEKFEAYTHQMTRHYTRVLEETETRVDALKSHVSEDYLARMKVGLQYWIDGGQKGYLARGIFVFRKR